MNKKIEELYNNLEAKDKIINEQVLEIARLKEGKKKAIEYIKKNAEYDEETNMCCFELSCSECIELLEILGDKENE